MQRNVESVMKKTYPTILVQEVYDRFEPKEQHDGSNKTAENCSTLLTLWVLD